MNDIVKVTDNYLIRGRTDYQLKHFVIGQHDTPEMRYRQIIIEAKSLLFAIRNLEIEINITKQKIAKLETKGDEISLLKAKQKKLGLAISVDTVAAAKKELDYLVELSKDYRHYTPAEIEANQPEYWELRLTRQATTDRIALEQGIDKGNLMSLMQAGLVQNGFNEKALSQ